MRDYSENQIELPMSFLDLGYIWLLEVLLFILLKLCSLKYLLYIFVKGNLSEKKNQYCRE